MRENTPSFARPIKNDVDDRKIVEIKNAEFMFESITTGKILAPQFADEE
jgi:hypothetical protein